MAKVFISLTDSDLELNSYRADFHVEDAEMDDGHATASVVVGRYIFEQLQTPEFVQGATEFSIQLNEAINGGETPPSDLPCTAILCLTDVDLEKGSYKIDIEIGNRQEDKRPTAALFAALFIRSCLSNAEFVSKVWQYAETLCQQSAGKINNLDQAPGSVADNDDNEEAEVA